jgi:hypothetical protein
VPRTSHQTFADQAIRVIAVATVSGLAALAARISYRHMLLLAERSHEYGLDAHAFPLTVDGLDVIGVLVLLADRRTGRRSGWLPWTVLTIGTLASIAANIAVAPNNPVARAISGWSAVALLAAAKMLAHLFEPTQLSQGPNKESADDAVSAGAQALTSANDEADDNHGDTVGVRGHQRRRVTGDAARRIPTSDAARANWVAIWHATKHLDSATSEVAAAHGVSLRTLQFIRAAGLDGHLEPRPAAPAPTANGSIPVGDDPATQADRHSTRTGAVT